MASLNWTQQIIVGTVPKFTGVLSFTCSSLVIKHILGNKNKRKNTYHRLLCIMSVGDCIISLCYIIGTIPIPRGEIWGALGNNISCDIVAFLNVLGASFAPMMNVSLATFYLLMLKCEWSNRRIKTVEKYLISLPVVWALIMVFSAVGMGALGSANWVCWITAEYPALRLASLFVPVWIGVIYVLTVMCLIWLRVRDIEDKTASWSFRADRSKKKRVKSRRVMHQAFEYVGAMILTWSFSTVARISQWTTDNNGVAFPLLVLMTIFVPLQGALNYLIYFQPKWLNRILAKRRKSKLAMMKAKELPKIAVVREFTRKHPDTNPALNSASNPNPSLKPVAKDTQIMSTRDNSDRIEKIAKSMKRRQSENSQTLIAESEQDRRTSMPSLYVKIRSTTHMSKKESLTRLKKKMGHMNGKSVHFGTHTIDTDGYQFPLKQGDACVEEILPADFGLDNIDVGNSDADPNYRPMEAQDEENIDSSFSSADESSFGSKHGKEEFLPGHLMNDGILGFQDTIERQGSGQFFLPGPTAATSIVDRNFDKRSAEDLHPPSRLDRKDILTGNDSEDSGDHLDDDYMDF